MSLLTWFLCVPFLFGAACATGGAVPSESAERAFAAIRAAEAGGAAHNAAADLYLRLAKDQYAYAHRLPNPNDAPRVERLLARAQVDAELALAVARHEEQEALLGVTLEEGKASIRDAKDSEQRTTEDEQAAAEHSRATSADERAAKEADRRARSPALKEGP